MDCPAAAADDDQVYGIYLSSNDGKIIGNKVYDSDTGIANQFYNLRALIRDNEVYGNRYGIADNASTGSNPADVSLITNNVVHNNIFRGISSGFNGTARIIGNTVYGQSAVGAIGIESNQEVGGNVVYGNYNGIAGSSARTSTTTASSTTRTSASAPEDSCWRTGCIRIRSVSSTSAALTTAAIADNVVYANTNVGILLNNASASRRLDVVNNTVYQTVGDAVRITGSGQNIRLRDNILWVEAGYDILCGQPAQTAVTSDYNLLYKGADPNAHVGFWNNANQDSLPAWQTASGQDAHSLSSQPQFVDRDGADNVFGFAQVNSVFVDGGADDNFYLRAGSPGIDSGYSWSYAVDAERFVRRDDTVTANLGSTEYFPAALGSSLFAATGTPLFFRSGSNNVNLPFSFPFYDANLHACLGLDRRLLATGHLTISATWETRINSSWPIVASRRCGTPAWRTAPATALRRYVRLGAGDNPLAGNESGRR